ncbi:universal stress protein [Natrarchaeobaculum aegyptiacum]|uniref:Universal stress protein UspA n=1 Tax=Natrarchaeobaculum aegyptiacum TaxID=745377 RepID=A0A2Z2HWU7_9EURY|nr:universal stress protein [Natrarchaeobaculum aegyptiacum]ARS90097.1 universal stress protein UspA [Natrarchaeobaculum aegyptiacum]
MATSRDHRVLVPVDVLGGEAVPEAIVETLASVPVTLLAYRELPDQVGTDHAREQWGDRARGELEALADAFREADCVDVRTRLVFTHDRLETIERVAIEERCTAIALLEPAPVLESVLLAVRGDVNLEPIAAFLGGVLDGTDLTVTILHVTSGDDREQGIGVLETAADELAAAGVDRERIGTSLVVDGSPTRAILAASTDHDLLVVGESRPSVRRLVFRDRARVLARGAVDPVLVVRGEYLSPADDAADDENGESESRSGGDDTEAESR